MAMVHIFQFNVLRCCGGRKQTQVRERVAPPPSSSSSSSSDPFRFVSLPAGLFWPPSLPGGRTNSRARDVYSPHTTALR